MIHSGKEVLYVEENKRLHGVLGEFAALSAIPRPSGHEERVSTYLMDTLSELGLSPTRDSALNVICDVPPTEGLERNGRLVLQAHSDMVCVGSDDYRPEEDSIRWVIQDGWLQTDGRSSLGADCGIGLAAILYLLRSHAAHGPLRLIFTANEERGLAGATALSEHCLADCDGLINMDGFHAGKLIISSAGGVRQTFSGIPAVFPPMLDQAACIHINGLRGGHSGDDIGLGRGNSAQLMLWLLNSLSIPYELGYFSSGTAHNAIPTEAEAVLVIDRRDWMPLRQEAEMFLHGLQELYGDSDPDLQIEISEAPLPSWVMTVDQRDDLLAMAGLITCGPWEEHPFCPGCVGSSCNLGRVYANENEIEIMSFVRSCHEEQIKSRQDFYAAAAAGFGLSVYTQAYAAWPGVEADPLSDLLMSAGAAIGFPMEKRAAHVGLEASIFHAMSPDMPIVCMGMEIHDPHSVRERVRVDTIAPVSELLEIAVARYGRRQKEA